MFTATGGGKGSITLEPDTKVASTLIASLLYLGSMCGMACSAMDVKDGCLCTLHVTFKSPPDPDAPCRSDSPVDDDFNLARMRSMVMAGAFVDCWNPVTGIDTYAEAARARATETGTLARTDGSSEASKPTAVKTDA